MPEQDLMTVSEVAAYLGINDNAVWLFSQTGAIPKPVDHNGALRWRRSDIEAAPATTMRGEG
jgi:predicted DNA-binding transcriptional regulator AlpA